jgi:ABC-2 type transport system ATP-binding protein
MKTSARAGYGAGTGAFCRVDGVSKRYGGTTVLRVCSFALERGEVLGLAGPNGAGKTTLSRILTGFARPSTGSALLEGLPAERFRRRRGVGYLQEEVPRYWEGSVADLLALRAAAAGPLPVSRAAELLGIAELAARPLRKLSKGQWRRVLTACAVAGPPALVVLDEPDSGLDPGALDALATLVRACAAAGAAVVVLSHQLPELEALCDRVAFLAAGELMGPFAPAELPAGGLRELYRERVLR